VDFSPEVVGREDRETLEDLTRAAVSDAITRVKEQLRDQFSSLAGGMQLPPGLLGL